ncbi:hypothetical protein WAF17_08525 [Bernardetia sp. ABR2-2B]|uniref:hypothetical protein n=1 Tax=Bernardetia sp. ABR2-2B TaxID=3127472 RepID=UPI0030D4CC73
MKSKARFLFIALLLGFVFTSCEWKNEEEEGITVTDCDTSQVTLSGDVKPILQTNCYPCHSNTAASSIGAGINLEDYESLKSRADGGSLLGSISHMSGFSPMPKGAAQISKCNLDFVKAWIENGAPND